MTNYYQSIIKRLHTSSCLPQLSLIIIECDINSINYQECDDMCKCNLIIGDAQSCGPFEFFCGIFLMKIYFVLTTLHVPLNCRSLLPPGNDKVKARNPWKHVYFCSHQRLPWRFFFVFVDVYKVSFSRFSLSFVMDELDHQKIFNKIIYKQLEPSVLNEEVIRKTVYEQGPLGEAGRIFREMEIQYEKVTVLRLEFLSMFDLQINL